MDTAMPRMPAPVTVAVIGSCVTRDIFNSRFNEGWADRYRLGPVAFRSSIVSLMAEPVPIDDADLAGLSESEARVVGRDFRKNALAELATEPADILLVDVTADVRFGCLDLGGGRYVTNNHWLLHRTPWFRARRASGDLPPSISPRGNKAAYRRLWRDAVRRLADHLREVAPTTTIAVVRGREITRLWLPGGQELVDLATHRYLPPGSTAVFDATWHRMTTDVLTSFGTHEIDMRAREYPTSDSHPWSASNTHYAPEYYTDLMAALDALDAGRRGLPAADHPGLIVAPRRIAVAPGQAPGRTWEGERGAGEMRPRPPARPGRAAPAPVRRGWLARLRRRARRLLGRSGGAPR